MKKKFNEIPGVIYTYSLNQFIKKEKGITLVALVITIIVLLILSGITIQSITHTGIFDNAKQAELENKRAQITEYLKLKLINEQTNNPFGSAEEIITATREDTLNKINELNIKLNSLKQESRINQINMTIEKLKIKLDIEEKEIDSIESFINSNWFNFLTKRDPDRLLEKLKVEVEKYESNRIFKTTKRNIK